MQVQTGQHPPESAVRLSHRSLQVLFSSFVQVEPLLRSNNVLVFSVPMDSVRERLIRDGECTVRSECGRISVTIRPPKKEGDFPWVKVNCSGNQPFNLLGIRFKNEIGLELLSIEIPFWEWPCTLDYSTPLHSPTDLTDRRYITLEVFFRNAIDRT